MSTLLCCYKNIEFYDDDLSCFCLPQLEIVTLYLTKGNNAFCDNGRRYFYELTIRPEYDKVANQIKISAINGADVEVASVGFPTEEFCGNIMKNAMEDKTLEIRSMPYWSDSVLPRIKEAITKNLYKNNLQLVTGEILAGSGVLKCGDNVISTIEAMKVVKKTEEALSGFRLLREIELKDCIVNTDLNNMEPCSVEFWYADTKISFYIDSMTQKILQGELTDYVVTTEAIAIEDSVKEMPPAKGTYVTIEDFIAAREKQLTKVSFKRPDEDMFGNIFAV